MTEPNKPASPGSTGATGAALKSAPPQPPASPPRPVPVVVAPQPAAMPSRSAAPVLSAIGFLLLCGGGAYLYFQLQQLKDGLAAVDPARIEALESAQKADAQSIAALDARPAAAPAADLKPLESRLAAVEAKLAAPRPAAAPAQAAPAQAAPAAPPPDIAGATAPLAAQIAALTSQTRSAGDAVNDKIAALEKRLADAEQRAGQAGQQAADATKRADQADSQASKTASAAAQLDAQLKAEAARTARLQQAGAALAAGQPLGDIAGGAPALVRFATAKPPTEAELRLSYPAAAEKAANASRPNTDAAALGDRMWLKARSLFTIKQGNTVIVGAPAAATLADAQRKLDAGDLAGAVASLHALDGPAAQAIAPWRDQAQALLDARAALSAMAQAKPANG